MPGQEMPPGIGPALLVAALLEHWMITLSFLAGGCALAYGLIKAIPLLFQKSKPPIKSPN